MTIQADTPVGQIATEYPMATQVFARHGMDFCCGGGQPIEKVCDSKGLDVAAVLDEIREAVAEPDSDVERWDGEEGTFILPKRVILSLGDRKIEIPAEIIMPIGKQEPIIQLK